MNSPDENLLEAVKRELLEETGFKELQVEGESPFFSGSHIMKKSDGPVRMTEHFFSVRLKETSDKIDSRRQALTAEELEVFVSQQWMGLQEIAAGNHIILPVNLESIVSALLSGEPVPEADFSDPVGW